MLLIPEVSCVSSWLLTFHETPFGVIKVSQSTCILRSLAGIGEADDAGGAAFVPALSPFSPPSPPDRLDWPFNEPEPALASSPFDGLSRDDLTYPIILEPRGITMRFPCSETASRVMIAWT